jgi:hypothetical protein
MALQTLTAGRTPWSEADIRLPWTLALALLGGLVGGLWLLLWLIGAMVAAG